MSIILDIMKVICYNREVEVQRFGRMEQRVKQHIKRNLLMDLLDLLKNRTWTIGQLALASGTASMIEDIQETITRVKDLHPNAVSSGRKNTHLVEGVIKKASGGLFEPGGDGSKDPDLIIAQEGTKPLAVEVKTEMPRRTPTGKAKSDPASSVGPSSLFANNSGTTKYNEFLQTGPTGPEILEYIRQISYGKNDYYLLTNTSAWDGDVKNMECVFVSTEILMKHLRTSGKKAYLDVLQLPLRREASALTNQEIEGFLGKKG